MKGRRCRVALISAGTIGALIQFGVFSSAAQGQTWSGAAGNGLWSDPGNWLGGVVPASAAGTVLGFPTGTPTMVLQQDVGRRR
jgi:hypothetical protein